MMRRGLCGYIARHDPRQRRWHPWISRDSLGCFFVGCPDFCGFFLLFFVPSVVHDDDFLGGIMLQNWLVGSTHLKNISQNGNLLQIQKMNEFPPKTCWICFFFKEIPGMTSWWTWKSLGFKDMSFQVGNYELRQSFFHHPKGFPHFPWISYAENVSKTVCSWRCFVHHRITYRNLRIPQFTSFAFKKYCWNYLSR